MFDGLKSEANFSIDLGLMNQLLSLHGLLEHLVGHVLAHNPASAVLLLVDDLTHAGLRWHLLETVNDGEVFSLDVAVEVV